MGVFDYVESRNQAIIENAIEWANERACSPIYQEEIAVLSSYLSINVPRVFYNFEYTEKVGQCRATGGFKTIMKFLDRLQREILSGKLDDYKK